MNPSFLLHAWLHRVLFGCWLVLVALPLLAQNQTQPDYRLGAGDTVRVLVFQSPDLTVEARVSESGSINVPLIGNVAIGGLSIADAERKIANALQTGGFLQKPQVNIVLIQVRGNQVSVLGHVNRPGRFPLEIANTRVTDVLAMAGGVMANGDDVVIVSGARDGAPFRKLIDVPALFMRDNDDSNMLVSAGDTIYVRRAPVFYVYGEVQRAGAYRIERNMTVMQGLATGGGPTSRGTENRLRLHRRDAGGAVQQTAPELTDLLQPDDVIYVRESLF
ncbi:polysaccharide export protein EpsE [Pseudorhodoferax sp. Leaf265]|uniref:polysaccharide export protein EpsE n=1 Tax=Pseudorhodoferax sp. Leaf265 TaxID=1736315 RepID=UPI0006F5D655|nr:polysaccharide export protein EpsE [Pseudorhodoferax sp. Leaf265]KQP21176.1 polysaccharide export protein EpsE [Pseudorhodoferax sp. Leaf265]